MLLILFDTLPAPALAASAPRTSLELRWQTPTPITNILNQFGLYSTFNRSFNDIVIRYRTNLNMHSGRSYYLR